MAIDPSLTVHAWSMATAATVSAACGLVGGFLVVRRMSLLGDAVAHAVLPGIAVAVLAGGSLGGPLVFVGAVAAALLTVWLTQALRAGVGLAEDAGAGVVFTTLFAAGVVLVSLAATRIDLDPECVLYGILELSAFDRVSVAGFLVPRAWLVAVVVLAGIAGLLAATWRWQLFTAFDPAAARAAGVPVALVTGLLLAATAVAAVAGFEAVGAVLVVAMLVVPAATAELLVRRMRDLLVVAVGVSVTAACLGYAAAWQWNTSAAGMIAVVLGCQYALAVVMAPGDGVAARLAARLQLDWRVAREDCLARIWRACEAEAADTAPLPPPRSRLEWLARRWLEWIGRIRRQDGRVGLSDVGRREAEMVVRSHRLWETWLGRHAELPPDHLHPPAEWMEHHLGAAMRERIEAELSRGGPDPHGRAIPPEADP
jgi:manganese/zinc/iron transport system permease protein